MRDCRLPDGDATLLAGTGLINKNNTNIHHMKMSSIVLANAGYDRSIAEIARVLNQSGRLIEAVDQELSQRQIPGHLIWFVASVAETEVAGRLDVYLVSDDVCAVSVMSLIEGVHEPATDQEGKPLGLTCGPLFLDMLGGFCQQGAAHGVNRLTDEAAITLVVNTLLEGQGNSTS